VGGAALFAGYLADLILGDPSRWHPVAGFGQLALALERAMYAPSRLRGGAFAATLVAGAALGCGALARGASRLRLGRELVLATVTWAALGGRSLRRAGERVEACVGRGDLDGARLALPALCGRDATDLDATQLRRAAVESLAENTSDAVVGALLWGALAGPAGIGAYRAANTLDAMVGSRCERYERFGWAAARLDDAMNWPAARAGAALACLGAPLVGGSRHVAWGALLRDGSAHPSPNAGRMEAAFGGALGVRLGGPLSYEERIEYRPEIGGASAPGLRDVDRAARLSLFVGVAAAALFSLARTAYAKGAQRSSLAKPSAACAKGAPRGALERGASL
jgi:adenosylcobinamide-phosphate synthase